MRDDDEQVYMRCLRPASSPAPTAHKPQARRAKTVDRFVQVPLWWAERAARATKTPKAFVWLWLLHLSWKANSKTFPLPNGQLHARGVHRKTKERALRELEAAGLIQVERAGRKTVVVTLLYL